MACFCPLLWTSTQDEGVLVCTLQLSWKNWIYSRAVVNILPIRIGHKDILTAPKELTYPPPSGHWGAEETAGDWREKAAGGNKLGSLKATPYHDPRMNMSTRSFEIFFPFVMVLLRTVNLFRTAVWVIHLKPRCCSLGLYILLVSPESPERLVVGCLMSFSVDPLHMMWLMRY